MSFFKGTIRNYSSKTLWVVETDSGPAKAHKLSPNMKSPSTVDADGVKTVDGSPIDGHTSWWKIRDISTADIYDNNQNSKLTIKASFKSRVKENEFGSVEYKQESGWGEKISKVVSVHKNTKGIITEFLIDNGIGWINKNKAVELAKKGQIIAVVVNPKNSDSYIRSRPDSTKKNNFSNLCKN
jgi:hypothetical protein